jgi:hypothetical protein
MDKKAIKIVYNGYSIDIVLNTRITYLCSDSATGKTMLFSLLKDYALIEELPGLILFSCHSGTSYKELADVLKEAEDKIIFIDNADHALVKSEVYDAIDSDLCDEDSNNYYVLIGRDTRLANLVTSLAKPVISGDNVSIRYLFGG